MDFTELYRHSRGLVSYSPDGQMLANVMGQRLVVRDAASLAILKTWLVHGPDKEGSSPNDGRQSPMSELRWCPRSRYIALAKYSSESVSGSGKTTARLGNGQKHYCSSRAWATVRSVVDGQEDFICELAEGIAGMTRLEWAPTADALVVWSDWRTRLTVWKLDEAPPVIILAVSSSDNALSFHGNFCAILHRRLGKDSFSIYETSSWNQCISVDLATKEAAGISWNAQGTFLAVWDCALERNLYIYSCHGILVSSCTFSEDVGISKISWARNGTLAMGTFDGKLMLASTDPLEIGRQVGHLPAIFNDKLAVLADPRHALKHSALGEGITPYDPLALPLFLESYKIGSRPLNHSGVTQLHFNCDGTYLASVEGSAPHVLWIWAVTGTQLCLVSLLQHHQAIKAVQWSPTESSALISCSNSSHLTLYIGPGMAELIKVPFRDVSISDIQWRADGRALTLQDREVFTCVFLSEMTTSDDVEESTTIVK